MIQLFSVTTRVGEYHGCKDVPFTWFHWNRPTGRRPYAELIENYDLAEDNRYSVDCIDEMFTAIEAHALKEYLDREHGDYGTTTIEEVALPIPNNLIGYGAHAVGGGDDFYMLDSEERYSLPFKVRGYFNLVGCELADGSGEEFRHFLFCLGKGEFRPETQEEARHRDGAGP
jgi:hypothetical protein